MTFQLMSSVRRAVPAGMDLMEMLLQSGPMEEESAANIIQQMVEVLAYCQSHGIVHRDSKLQMFNISTR